MAGCTGGSYLRWIFWEHENLSGLSVLIYIKLYKEKEKNKQFWQKILAKQESGLTTVWLQQDPPVLANVSTEGRVIGSDVYCFFYGPDHILTLPAYNFEVFHCCCVASNILMFKTW